MRITSADLDNLVDFLDRADIKARMEARRTALRERQKRLHRRVEREAAILAFDRAVRGEPPLRRPHGKRDLGHGVAAGGDWGRVA